MAACKTLDPKGETPEGTSRSLLQPSPTIPGIPTTRAPKMKYSILSHRVIKPHPYICKNEGFGMGISKRLVTLTQGETVLSESSTRTLKAVPAL